MPVFVLTKRVGLGAASRSQEGAKEASKGAVITAKMGLALIVRSTVAPPLRLGRPPTRQAPAREGALEVEDAIRSVRVAVLRPRGGIRRRGIKLIERTTARADLEQSRRGSVEKIVD